MHSKRRKKEKWGVMALFNNVLFGFRQPANLLFGMGAIETIKTMPIAGSKVLIVTDEGICKTDIIDKLIGFLKERGMSHAIFSDVTPNPTLETVKKGISKYVAEGCNAIIAIGGGSSLDSAKAIGMSSNPDENLLDYATGLKQIGKLPQLIAIPTTAGTGSETSKFAVIIDPVRNNKVVFFSDDLIPSDIIADPQLTASMPGKLTAITGIDALSHLVEPYTNTVINPIVDKLAEYGISLIGKSLRQAFTNGDNLSARYNVLLGSLIGGILGNHCWMGNAHPLSFPLTQKFHIDHGTAISILLPHVCKFNLMAVPVKFKSIAAIMGEKIEGLNLLDAAAKGVDSLANLTRDLQMPQKLGQFGVKSEDLEEMATEAIKSTSVTFNPRKSNVADLVHIYQQAL